jgi:amino acid transporter
MNLSESIKNEIIKWHIWYKIVVGLYASFMLFVWFLALLEDDFNIVDSDILPLIIVTIVGFILFHFIIYKGIYIYLYKLKLQKDLKNLAFNKERDIISEDEFFIKAREIKDKLYDK